MDTQLSMFSLFIIEKYSFSIRINKNMRGGGNIKDLMAEIEGIYREGDLQGGF